MKFARLLLQRLMPILAALAFLALPASSEPLCDPHEQHGCAAEIAAVQQHDDAGSDDPASTDHGVHAHGNCHVPMTQPDSVEFSALAVPVDAVPALIVQSASSALVPSLERPPRA